MNAGNRTRMTENNGDYTTYAYDDIYQLTGQTKRNSADTIQFQYSYAYDDVGNRVTETDADGDITTYSYNVANQLTHTVADGTRVTYTYDSNGNMTGSEDSGGTTSFDYSCENRMEVVTYPDSTKTTFAYNAAGKRVLKEDSSGTVKYLYDRDKVVLERDGDDNTVARYTHEGGSLYEDLISMKRDGSSYQYLFDGLGSISEVVDSSEATQNSYRYEAFGQIESSTSSVSNPYAYVGAYGVHRDPGPSLYFMQARYYKAGIGRFVSRDPFSGSLQDPRSLHRYLYTGNNPVNTADPGGLFNPYVCIFICLGFFPVYLECLSACQGAAAMDELRKILDKTTPRAGDCMNPESLSDCMGCPGGRRPIFVNNCVSCCSTVKEPTYSCENWCDRVWDAKQEKDSKQQCQNQ